MDVQAQAFIIKIQINKLMELTQFPLAKGNLFHPQMKDCSCIISISFITMALFKIRKGLEAYREFVSLTWPDRLFSHGTY